MGFTFPQRLRKYFDRFVLLENISNQELVALTNVYTQMTKNLTYKTGAKRLLLKNPVNTARISWLLKIFPTAKFIYLHRDPFDVKASMKRMIVSLIGINTLQTWDVKKLDANIHYFYKALLDRYAVQKCNLNPTQLVEISYTDLTQRPLQTLEQVYSHFELPGFDPQISNSFIKTHRSYQPFNYTLLRSNGLTENNVEVNTNWYPKPYIPR